jgi:hypothetical protein
MPAQNLLSIAGRGAGRYCITKLPQFRLKGKCVKMSLVSVCFGVWGARMIVKNQRPVNVDICGMILQLEGELRM